ncbi:aminotransferase class V-fold PLP-dependent enzyme [Nakamurella endophytica]|uniref:Cysteine desulfurase n=1 Tax=Nakamurella endophytica TaxID=1748367 RepID=A0A917SZF4_9ACTN|nr:aminotransferase class V-fold PLP-dependent enzyme [Nakamurella endophytica]GGM04822.1 cysteine desulfurase [Nakamurella endophytica]
MTVALHRPDWQIHLAGLATDRTTLPPPADARSRAAALPGPGRPHAPGLEVVGAAARVPLATGGHVEYANLDHAASAPALRVVRDAVDTVLDRYASVHRGAGWHSRLCTSLYEGAREPVRRFVGGRPDDAVVFTRNTTDAFALLAHCLPPRTTVVVFETEHHAALLPWERTATVVRLAAPADADDAVAAAEAALRRRSPGPALLVVTGASNVTGEVWPVARLAAVARARGARVVLDAAQLAPHRSLSVAELGVDYVAVSGHKLYAPYGAGALVGRSDWLSAAPPYLLGGGACALVGDRETRYAPVPARHEGGTPNVVGAVALATACHALGGVDRSRLTAVEAALTARLADGLAAVPGVTVHRLWPSADAIGVVTFTVAGQPAAVVAAALSAEHGIGVRDGAFCAHPLVRRLLGAAGDGDGGCGTPGDVGQAIRASAGLGTSTEHVDRLLRAVRSIAAHGPRLAYVDVDGRPAPAVDVDGRPAPAVDGRPVPALVPWL